MYGDLRESSGDVTYPSKRQEQKHALFKTVYQVTKIKANVLCQMLFESQSMESN